MTIFLTVLHVMVCLVLIVVVLLQRGKGAEIGAVFGGGAGSTVFGSRGAGNFLTKLTTGAAIVFMVTSLTLSYFATQDSRATIFGDEVIEETLPSTGVLEETGEADAGLLEEIDDSSAGLLEEIEPEAAEEAPATP